MHSVCFSSAQTQQMDSNLLPDIRMATLSESNGFEWINERRMDQILNKADKLQKKLKGEMQSFMQSGAN